MGSDQQEIWGRWAAAADRPDRDDRIDKVVTDYSNQPRDATRVPLAHRIQLKFDRFTGFINEYLSNLSPGGIFIRTDTPEPPGQLLDFEFRLGDGYELIRGRGEVVWARERPDGPERPPGMGVRFIELSPGSKDLIYKIVDDYTAHGGKPFDLTPPAALADPPVPAAAPGAGLAGAAAGAAIAVAAPGAVLSRAAPGAALSGIAPVLAPLPQPPPSPAPAVPPDAAGGAPGLPPLAGPSRPAAARPPAGPSSLPWTLELPPIQPLPGVPAITPRSPLESMGAGPGPAAAAAVTAAAAGTEPGADAAPAEEGRAPKGGDPSHGEAAATGAWPGGGQVVAGPATDPLALMAAALPPLEELAPDVPALAPAPAPAVAPAAVMAAAPAPAFSSFDQPARRRRSRLPLLGVVVAVALLGLAAYLLRDTALTWIENREDEAAVRAGRPASAVPAAVATRMAAAPAAGPRGDAAPSAAPASAVAAAAGAATPVSAAPAPGQPRPAPAPEATTEDWPQVATPPGGATKTTGAPGVQAPLGSHAATAGTAAPANGGGAPPGAGPGGPQAPAGRPILEPVATADGERGSGAAGGGAGRVTTVERITWQATGDGTVVVLWGNGEFPGQSYTRVRIGGLPVREVVRITGIDRPFPSARLTVHSPELAQIRTGYHPPRDLHVVLDLAGRDVQVTDIEPGPHQLRIHLRAR